MTIPREDLRFWDIRTIERRVRKGLVAHKDVEKHIKALPDSTDRIAPREEDEESLES